jgi:hypothetical protein
VPLPCHASHLDAAADVAGLGVADFIELQEADFIELQE